MPKRPGREVTAALGILTTFLHTMQLSVAPVSQPARQLVPNSQQRFPCALVSVRLLAFLLAELIVTADYRYHVSASRCASRTIVVSEALVRFTVLLWMFL